MLCARYNDSITKILTRPWGKVNEDRDHLSLALDKQALESPSGPPIRKHIVLDSDQEINFLANNSELNAPPDISNATTNALIGIFFNILLNISKNFFPKKDRDNQPINVIINKAIIISTPGISKGR